MVLIVWWPCRSFSQVVQCSLRFRSHEDIFPKWMEFRIENPIPTDDGLVVTGPLMLFFHSVGNNNHTNWRTHISRGVQTTNQMIWGPFRGYGHHGFQTSSVPGDGILPCRWQVTPYAALHCGRLSRRGWKQTEMAWGNTICRSLHWNHCGFLVSLWKVQLKVMI